MAQTLSKTGISTSNNIEAWQVSQSIDAFTGAEAYNITISGSLNLTGSNVTGSFNGNFTGSFTGSLYGTSSWASNVNSAAISTAAYSVVTNYEDISSGTGTANLGLVVGAGNMNGSASFTSTNFAVLSGLALGSTAFGTVSVYGGSTNLSSSFKLVGITAGGAVQIEQVEGHNTNNTIMYQIWYTT